MVGLQRGSDRVTGQFKQTQRRQFLLQCLRGGATVAMSLFAAPAWSRGNATVRQLRLSRSNNKPCIVFELSAPVGHHIFTLHDPERIVIDLSRTSIANDLAPVRQQDLSRSIVHSIRYAPRNRADLRVVLDLSEAASPRSFLLPPIKKLGYRLVVELHSTDKSDPVPVLTANKPRGRLRDVVIAIDAGHGGEDPGAIGRRGTREKEVVLSIARKLESLIEKEKGMRAVMIRRSDVFIPLRTRILRARENKADIFVSIHADAAKNHHARGSSVYVLSEHGASSEAARWLAEKENSVDFIGGVSMENKDDLLREVLLDLSQTATIEASMKLADEILTTLRLAGKVHSHRVEQAGFVVLKSPDIPSVLVESAYLSNPSEERHLRSSSFQLSVAQSILSGLKTYLRNNAPAETLLQSLNRTEHTIKSGETLSTIAQRYDVRVDQLRSYNALENDRILEGQVLLIPSGS